MIIRDATENDNLKMLDIQKNAAQVGEFEITLIKADFRSKSNFFSDGFYLVAEDEKTSDIIGFLGVGIDHFKVKDKVYQGAYLYDLRTNPRYRGKVARWLKSISEETANRLRKMGIDFYFASVKTDNQPSMKLLKHFNLTSIYSYITYAVPVFNKKISKKTKIEVDFDVKELEDFYSEVNNEIDFLPIDLKNNFLKIIRDENRLVKFSYNSAQIIGWDTRGIADIGVTNLSKKYKILLKTLDITSKLIPFINAPVLHKTMKSFRVLKFEYKEENDFKILLTSLSGYCYKNKFFLIIFFIPENQSFHEKVLGKLKFRTDLIIAANSVTNVDFSNLKNLISLPRL
jgi:hypothetical protein